MRILTVSEALPSLAFRSAGPGRRTRQLFLDRHEVLVDALPAGVDALVATGDLQSRELSASNRLLGEAVAEQLIREMEPKRLGALLAGDFYANEGADKLGSSGEVGKVWRAFAKKFRWTVGVLGNHDRLKESVEGTTLLDGHVIEFDGLRIAGIGGIVGKAGRLLRRDLKSYLDTLDQVLSRDPHVLVLHESPAGDLPEFRGNPHITELLSRSAPTLVVCGHCRWPFPLKELTNGTQILNVDSRLCILRATFAEFEADLIRHRTREGMAIARAKGKLKGKQPKLSPRQQKELQRMHETGDYTISDLAELFSVSRPTVYRTLVRSGKVDTSQN